MSMHAYLCVICRDDQEVYNVYAILSLFSREVKLLGDVIDATVDKKI